ncbi:MAG: hypothetical protein K2W96_05380 [Gemmataceae bacterium]|nr:hypothetical protein [Gemmataceae bacterium]
MVFAYLLVLVLLAVAQVLLRWRAAGLERRYLKLAAQADALVKQAATRGGNTNRPDPAEAALRQYELARVALKRDRVETSHAGWERAAGRLGGLRTGMASWKGRVLPYLMGVLDVAGLVVVLHWLGIGPEQVASLLGLK